MTIDLVLLPDRRAVVTGVSLPAKAPTRVYIGNQLYRIAAPAIALPPFIGGVKTVLNWVLSSGLIAKNIFYLLKTGAGGSTSDPVWLKAVANQVMTSFNTAGMQNNFSSDASLTSVTCHDTGGTSAASTSDHAPIPGLVSPPTLPPQSSVVVSWQISASYRGGKPRTYFPGIPANAQAVDTSAAITPTYANQLRSMALTWMNGINAATVSGAGLVMGTLSYHSGHAVRPTPLFQPFITTKVHERLDSQRRRSGKESAYPTLP